MVCSSTPSFIQNERASALYSNKIRSQLKRYVRSSFRWRQQKVASSELPTRLSQLMARSDMMKGRCTGSRKTGHTPPETSGARAGRLRAASYARKDEKLSHACHEIALTDAIKTMQEDRWSRASYARFQVGLLWGDRIGADEAAFIATRDSFYMTSTSETGWPYVQHCHGPTGFTRVLDETTIAFADFAGQQAILDPWQHTTRRPRFFCGLAEAYVAQGMWSCVGY